jgi:hypothetical protein
MHGYWIVLGGAENELQGVQTINVKAIGFGADDQTGAVLVEAAIADLLVVFVLTRLHFKQFLSYKFIN